MSITFPLSLPDLTSLRDVVIMPRSAVAIIESPYTFSRQTQANQGKAWAMRGTIVPKNGADADDWAGFFVSMNGPEGSFLFSDIHNSTPNGEAASAPGVPLVLGASQVGDELTFDGVGATVTDYLKRGDWIQLGSGASARLYMITANASSNGSGEVTADIWPDLYSSPAENAVVTVSGAQGVFSLAGGFEYPITAEHIYNFTFAAFSAVD